MYLHLVVLLSCIIGAELQAMFKKNNPALNRKLWSYILENNFNQENENMVTTVKDLLDQGANPNCSYSDTPPSPPHTHYLGLLSTAVRYHKYGIATQLVKAGAHVKEFEDATFDHNSIVHTMIMRCYCLEDMEKERNFIQTIIEAGADINIEYEGETPLIHALNTGLLPVAKIILNAGPILTRRCKGKTAYDIAISKGFTELAEIIKALK